jgi:hypothetical protein
MLTPCAAGEVVGAKLKCVYWITQHKDGGKGKNRPTLKTVGMGHGGLRISDCAHPPRLSGSRWRAGIAD